MFNGFTPVGNLAPTLTAFSKYDTRLSDLRYSYARHLQYGH